MYYREVTSKLLFGASRRRQFPHFCGWGVPAKGFCKKVDTVMHYPMLNCAAICISQNKKYQQFRTVLYSLFHQLSAFVAGMMPLVICKSFTFSKAADHIKHLYRITIPRQNKRLLSQNMPSQWFYQAFFLNKELSFIPSALLLFPDMGYLEFLALL